MTIGVNGAGSFANDLIKTAYLYTSSVNYSGWRLIAAPHVTVDPASDTYRDASLVGMTANGVPTTFPSGTDALFLLIAAGGLSAASLGTYDVTFSPGLEWSFSGGSGYATRTAYDSAAGTATITIDSLTGNGVGPVITFTGTSGVSRTLPSGLYFHAFKQGADTSKRVNQATKDALAPFAGGFIRMMGPFGTNRAATANVTYNALDTWFDDDSLTWQMSFAVPPVEVITEIATDCGMEPWINIYDLASDSAVTDLANRVLASWDGDFALEYSNEMWNFGAAFSQSSSLNARATTAGVANTIQYSRELKAKIVLFQAVYADQTSKIKPIMAWQSTTSAATWDAMLDEGSIYQSLYGCAIAPYGGGGIGGYTVGDYNNTTTISKADRDLVLTDAAAFKTACFAALSGASYTATMAAWFAFVEVLRSYAEGKGLDRTALRPCAYEHSPQHIVEVNTPTASSQDQLTRQAFAEMERDARMGALAVRQIEDLADCGADLCFFALASVASASVMVFGCWGMMDHLSDTTQEPYASVTDYLAAPPQRERANLRLVV